MKIDDISWRNIGRVIRRHVCEVREDMIKRINMHQYLIFDFLKKTR